MLVCTCCGRYKVEHVTRIRHGREEILLRLHWYRPNVGDWTNIDFTDPDELGAWLAERGVVELVEAAD